MTRTQTIGCTAQNRRHRGSVILLTVVALVALTILGVSFIQVARVQREVVDESPDNIVQALDRVISEIKIVMKDDVISPEDGVLFGQGVEPFDYPITNYDSPYREVDGKVGALGREARFGMNDDAWLASVVPEVANTTAPSGVPEWRQITLLTGAYYPSDKTDNPPPLMRQVQAGIRDQYITNDEDGVNVVGDYQFNHNVDIILRNLVDTDGDGIGDARWERVPQPDSVIEGYEYFFAARIIDASALLNIMAATAATSDGIDGSTTGNITGYFPTSLDMSRLAFKKMGANWTNGLDAYFGVDGVRNAGTLSDYAGPGTVYPTPLSDPLIAPLNLKVYPGSGSYGPGQASAWLRDAAAPGNLAGRKHLEALFELHWRGGVNNDAQTISHELDLGDTASDDLLSDPYDYTSDNDHVRPITRPEYHFVGTDPTSVPNTRFVAVRHLLTTVSGYGVYSPNFNDMLGGFGRLEDLVYWQTEVSGAPNPQGRVNRFQKVLERVFGGLSLASTRNAPLAAGEYACAIQEYSDPDGAISATWFDIDGTFYGLEALPFLREVYFQVGYDDGSSSNDGVWEPVIDSDSGVIEIGNPFDRSIIFNDAANTNPNGVRVRIAVEQTPPGAPAPGIVSSYEIPASVLPPRDPDTADEHFEEMILVFNGTATTTEDSVGNANDLKDALSIPDQVDYTGILRIAPANTLTFNKDGSEVVIALQTLRPGPDITGENDADWVTYDRLFALRPGLSSDSASFPETVTFSPGWNLPGKSRLVKNEAFIQHSIRRDGENIRYLSNTGKYARNREPTPPTAAVPGIEGDWPDLTSEPWTDVTTYFANDDKGLLTTGDTSLDNFQIPIANRPIFSVAELAWIHMFGFGEIGDLDGNGIDDGDFAQRLSGTGPGTVGISPYEWTLQFDGSGNATDAIAFTVPTAGADAEVTYSEAVLSAFTTLSPRHDGVDNDSDQQIDEANEQLVFGPMNINTAPYHLATLAAPIPDTLVNIDALMSGLLDYRDDNDGSKQYAGVASIGEMMNWVVQNAASAGIDTSGPQWDLYPMPEQEADVASGGQSAKRYGVTDDAEAVMRVAQFLPQAYSVRSDIYIAYILVKGYGHDIVTGELDTEEPVESIRVIVVFDRSGLTNAVDDDVRVLGMYIYR